MSSFNSFLLVLGFMTFSSNVPIIWIRLVSADLLSNGDQIIIRSLIKFSKKLFSTSSVRVQRVAE